MLFRVYLPFRLTIWMARNLMLMPQFGSDVWLVSWLLELYILVIMKVISECLPTCDSKLSWWLYSAAPLDDQTTQSQYPGNESTSLCLIHIVLRVPRQDMTSINFLNIALMQSGFEPHNLPKRESVFQPIGLLVWPRCLKWEWGVRWLPLAGVWWLGRK